MKYLCGMAAQNDGEASSGAVLITELPQSRPKATPSMDVDVRPRHTDSRPNLPSASGNQRLTSTPHPGSSHQLLRRFEEIVAMMEPVELDSTQTPRPAAQRPPAQVGGEGHGAPPLAEEGRDQH